MLNHQMPSLLLIRLALCPWLNNSLLKEIGWEEGKGGLSFARHPNLLKLQVVVPCQAF